VLQNVSGMEIILVDDGSPDTCPQKCDEWAQKSDIIHTLHKENGGLSDARNVGISISHGDYITFIDSDDYVEQDTYVTLLKILINHPEYDILEYPVKNQGCVLTFYDKAYSDKHFYWYSTKAYKHTYACNKIFRRTLFDNVKFPKGKVFEDMYTYPLLLDAAHIVATTSKGLYHYCQNQASITAKADGNEWRMLLEAYLNITKKTLFLPATEEFYLQLLNVQLYTCELTGDHPQMPPIRFHNIINIKTVLNNILGINLLCKINRLFRRIIKRHS
jgi:glycosyltransferase involved in cell wall biosynthesis